MKEPCHEKMGKKENFTHGETRTRNLRFRRPTPYPLGHAGIDTCMANCFDLPYFFATFPIWHRNRISL